MTSRIVAKHAHVCRVASAGKTLCKDKHEQQDIRFAGKKVANHAPVRQGPLDRWRQRGRLRPCMGFSPARKDVSIRCEFTLRRCNPNALYTMHITQPPGVGCKSQCQRSRL